MFGRWCILLRRKHRRGWHSPRVGVVGIRFVWVSHGKKREFGRACLAKEVRRDSQLDVAREKSWNLACMFDKRSRKGLGFVCLQDQQNGCLTGNCSSFFPQTGRRAYGTGFAAKEFSLRLSWLLHGKKTGTLPLVFGKTTGRDLSVYMAEKISLYGKHAATNTTHGKTAYFSHCCILAAFAAYVFRRRLGFIGLPGTQNSLLYTEPFPIFFAAETTHGKQDIFAAIAATLTNKMVSSHGTDPDFSGRLADKHTAQDVAVKELDICIVRLSRGKKQELGRAHLGKEMGKDLSAYKAIKIALHNKPVVDFFRRPNEDRRTQDLGAAAPPARKRRCKESPCEPDAYVAFAVYACGGHTKRLAFCLSGCRTGINGNFAAHI